MKVLQKIATVFLAAVFLFSSLGFTISSMVCLKSGKGKISLAKIEDCCFKNVEPVVINEDSCCKEELAVIKKGSCCDINSYTFNLTDFQNSQKIFAGQPSFVQLLFSFSESISPVKAENKLAFHYSDLPPPLYGRTLLNYISTLTI